MTLTFDHQGQILGQMTGYSLETKLTGLIAFFDVKISANAMGKYRDTFSELHL